MRRTLVLNVVGLTPRLLRDHAQHMPSLSALAKQSRVLPLRTITPAVTCSVQSTLVTGLLPREHGIVANGWYFRDLAEIWLWRQSNHLVAGEKVWDAAKQRDPAFRCAKLFFWYNMYSTADVSITPRPIYLADGRKLPDVYTEPYGLRAELTAQLGTFPLFNFWGPNANIASTQWIGRASRYVYDTQAPTLTLVYLPHLDYCLQKYGPNDPRIVQELREVDAVCGELIDHVAKHGTRVVVLSEYGITEVNGVVHINRVLREAGLLRVRDELGREQLDAGASQAFAVADHQLAHVYVKDATRVAEVAALLSRVPGIEHVLGDATTPSKRDFGLDHPRSGELVAISAADRWFSYYHFLDDARAPDFARCVEIHRKPGYDPVELFLDPALALPKLQVAWRLGKRRLGFRSLLDVIALDASLVRGSHGRLTDHPEDGPLLLSSAPELVSGDAIDATDVKRLLLEHVFS
jgi:predicted AlkP superfamily pyrophosphatase or phosphodiesterase